MADPVADCLTGRCWPWAPCSSRHRGTCHGYFTEPFTEPQRWKVRQLHELHAADRPRIGARGHLADRPADAASLEGQVDYVRPVARQMVTDVQQPTGLDLQAGLLAHLPHQGGGEGLAFLDLAARQAPRPPGVSVLVQQQNAIVLDDDAGHAHMHPANILHQDPA